MAETGNPSTTEDSGDGDTGDETGGETGEPPDADATDFDYVHGYGGFASRPQGVGDIDGDGDLDVAYYDIYDGSVAVLFGEGDGTFGLAELTSAPNGSHVLVGDFDEDGRADVVLQQGTGWVLLHAEAGGTLAPPVPFLDQAGDRGAAVADVDGDGHLDLIEGWIVERQVTVAFGSGEGSVSQTATVASGDSVRDLAMGDVDGDGSLDVVAIDVSISSAPRVWVGLQLAPRTFAAAVSSDFSAASPPAVGDLHDVAVGDMDGDGDDEISIADEAGVTVLDHDAGGVFEVRQRLGTAQEDTASGLAMADLDGDGFDEIIVGTFDAAELYVWPASVEGLGDPTVYTQGGRGSSIWPADLDDDGDLDLLLGTGSVGVALGRGDGTLRAGVRVPGSEGAQALAFADLDGDGADELVVGRGASTVVAIHRGGASLAEPALVDIGQVAEAIEVSDLDADGHADVVIGGDSILTALGDDAGMLTLVDSAPASLSHRLGDVTGDGFPDVIGLDFETIVVRRSTGDGHLLDGLNYEVPQGIWDAVVMDLDDDGRGEVVAASVDGASLVVWWSSGDALDPTHDTVMLGEPPYAVAAQDLDGDGRDDLIVGLATGGVATWRNTGDGSLPALTPEIPWLTSYYSTEFAFGDFDADGLADLLSTIYGGGNFVLATTDRDGALAAEVTSFAMTFGRDFVVGDFDGNGRSDFAFTQRHGTEAAYSTLALNRP